MKHLLIIYLFVISLSACSGDDSTPADEEAITEVELGKLIFDDHNLSANNYQACSTCHDAAAGFSDPLASVAKPVSEGTLIDHFGKRNTPTAAYSQFSPAFSLIDDPVRGQVYSGGLFFDGRQNTLEEQALGPLLSLNEMAGVSKQAVVDAVREGLYANRFMSIYGREIFKNTENAFDKIILALTAFELSEEMNPFNSKFDCFIKDATQYPLSIQEQAGLDVFDGKGKCSTCHTLEPQPESGKVLLTNYQYFNIGVPVNPDNPANKADANFIDLGLGGRLSEPAENGKFKTPTLRNIAKTAPYMHNGVFSTLEEVVAFYNIDKKESSFPPPEMIDNITTEVDFLKLNDPVDIDAVVAFMKTLSDGTGIGICF